MAKQKGIVKLTGTIGDVSFYKSQDGFLARGKGGVDKSRIKNDPAFQRTRENGQEFGRAAKAGKVLRTAFRILIQNAKDRHVVGRMTKSMLEIVKSDKSNLRGQRTVQTGNQSLLRGFDFNIGSPLGSTIYAGYSLAIDRASGTVTITISEFIPDQILSFPSGATHFNLISGVGAIDYSTEAFQVSIVKSADIVIDNTPHELLAQSHELNTNGEQDIYVVLGVEFVEVINEVSYPLKGGSNCLGIIAVDQYYQEE